MNEGYVKKVEDLLTSINDNFGRGDIVQIDFENMKAHRKFQYGNDVRDFYIINNKVRFLSHERVIK